MQAIGRCIRHKHDYGAVILLEERLRSPRNQAYLSKWIRGRVSTVRSLTDATTAMSAFFKLRAEEPLDGGNALGTGKGTACATAGKREASGKGECCSKGGCNAGVSILGRAAMSDPCGDDTSAQAAQVHSTVFLPFFNLYKLCLEFFDPSSPDLYMEINKFRADFNRTYQSADKKHLGICLPVREQDISDVLVRSIRKVTCSKHIEK